MISKPIVALDVQFALWGYAVTGNVLDPIALLVEGYNSFMNTPLWDRRVDELAWDTLNDQPMPLYLALPWVTEQRLRKEIPGWQT